MEPLNRRLHHPGAIVLEPVTPTTWKNSLVINANWLMKLRWVAVAGQLATIVFITYGIGVQVQIPPLLCALAITSISNLGFTFWLNSHEGKIHLLNQPSHWNHVFMALMVLDLGVLNSLLYFTGGHTNPFILFYFVNLALSGILLPLKWAWLFNLLTIVSFASLFYFQVPLEELRQPESLLGIGETGSTTLAQKGLLVALVTCSTVIVYFVTRLTTELKLRDQALRRSEIRQARSEKWESLGTLAAGAAHELATPLTTIAVISKELERELELANASDTVIGDFRVLREELDRCRGILDRMSTDAGHVTTEIPSTIHVEVLFRQILGGLSGALGQVNLLMADEAKSASVVVPSQSFGMALRGIIQNALDASQEDPVELSVAVTRDHLLIRVCDHGIGMSQDVLERADEPFFSTKEAGRGMGLGRFLARSVIERLGGSFATKSTPNVGTEVTVRIPLEKTKEMSNVHENPAVR
ncbi:MAG: sensor histidine kinase [Planctomycetaceae bacterium]|jgi:two-component system sensor histidine kinase RegB|nr:sensor histidine kinase [Planctomycetaceae bacterium]MCH2594429.1 ATP-binding protein [Pirellulales bacterium]HCK40681.1 sensor histidine kinase [Planctomycetaceae bacterium]